MMNFENVLIAVPTRGQIKWTTVTRLDEIRETNPELHRVLYQPGNLNVALTRNKIVAKFLAGDYEVLAMVDDDIVPSPHFLTMVDYLDDYAMICNPHPMPIPSDPGKLVMGVYRKTARGLENVRDLEIGVHECNAVATGCVVIRRDALEALGPNPFKMTNDPHAELTSDDFIFCKDLRDAGYRIGYFFDGWFCDHHSEVMLAPLLEGSMKVWQRT